MKILFIGNSHIYNYEVPGLVAGLAAGDGIECQTVMNAHGGWTLYQHTREPDVPYNVKNGGFDYIVLQEHTHPFNIDGKMAEACEIINGWAKDAGATLVLYMTWAQKWEEHMQHEINVLFHETADKLGALLAPVGEKWWTFHHEHPEIELYSPDGGHASLQGAQFAADIIWDTIKKHAIGNNKI